MVCNQCGAEYKNDLLQCPYCHSENHKEAKRAKRRILERYDREAADIKQETEKYPDKAANQFTKYLVLCIGAVLAVGIIVIVLYLLCSNIFLKLEYAGEKAHTAKLEAYFEAGDYAGLSSYMDEKDLYSRDYEKYGEVWDVYDSFTDMDEAIEHIEEICSYETFDEEDKRQSADYWLGMYVESAKQTLTLADEYTQDKVFRGNEEVLLELREEALGKLTDTGFSQEEIDRIYQEELENLTDMEERLFELLVP